MDASLSDWAFWRIGALAGSLVPCLLIVVMLLRVGARRFSPRLLAIAMVSGVLVAFLPLMIGLLEPDVRDQVDALRFFLLRAFVFAGLSEEGAKLLAGWFIVRPCTVRRSGADLILGCAGVGLGFALIENISYVLHASDEWKSTALIRAVSAVPMHAFLGLIMGFGLARVEAASGAARRAAAALATLLVCAALHGLYDLPMFLGELLPMTLPPVEALAGRLAVTTPTLLAATHVAAVAMTALAGLRAVAVCRREGGPADVTLSPALLDALVFSRATGIVLGGGLLLLASAAMGAALVADQAGAIRSFPLFLAGFGVFIGALGWGVGGVALREAGRWARDVARFAARRRLAAALLGVGVIGAAYWGSYALRYAVAIVLVMSGSALTTVGALDRALGNLDAALVYSPDLLYAYQARGNVYRVLQDYDRALADLDRAVALHPEDAGAHGSRALIYVARHDYARALPAFDRALSLEPDNAQIVAARGGARIETGDIAGATRDADRALQLKPDLSIGYELRARLLTEADDIASAITAYSEAIRTDPKSADAYFSRGRLHFESQNFAAASEDFWRASATGANRSYAMLWLYLARGHLGQDGAQELAGWSQATPQKAWPAPLAELFLGATTLAAASAMATTNDQQCELAFYFGELQLLSANQSEARRYLSRARDICPHDFIEARAARKDLTRLEALMHNSPAIKAPAFVKQLDAASPEIARSDPPVRGKKKR